MADVDTPMCPLEVAFKDLDEFTSVLYLEVPKNSVVILQVFFELYDGVAAVRTVTHQQQKGAANGGIVCILTTPGKKSACLGVLHALRSRVPWRVVDCDDDPFILNARTQGY